MTDLAPSEKLPKGTAVIANMAHNSGTPEKNWEKLLIETLMEMEVIHPQFTGSITLHFTQGGLGDIHRYEKYLKIFSRPDNKLSSLSK